ncbi:MAG: hypothetical protein QOH49_874 [Acidobacteriota bacterium]|jgi:hypothetical protein|nr:hypothetical protein [Acidobacteriota bacterium]
MNCLEFESQVEILARGALADARTRAAAEAHEESCQACAARLVDERALSTGLRALAAGMRDAEAPAHVETALLSAFRARAASAAEESSEAVVASNVVPMSGHAPARRWSWAKTFAVASMAAAASLALFVLIRPGAPQSAPMQSAMIEPPPGSIGAAAPTAVAQDTSSEGVVEGVEPSPTPGEVRVTTPRPTFIPRPRAMNVSYNRGGLSHPEQATDARAQEVATEFIPLMQAGPYTQAEEGHLVRVELPRSALASFGLPVNAEASGGRVKADVLMGQDGIARAIRFVR